MTLLHEAVEAKKLDTRVIERNLARGSVSPEEVKKAADKLPDDAENGEYVSIDSLMDDGEEGSLNGANGSLSH